MARQRSRVHISVGNVLEIVGCATVCYAIAQLVGYKWALIAGGVAILVAAELVYDNAVLRLPLPHLPHPIPHLRRAAWRLRNSWLPRKLGFSETQAPRRSVERVPSHVYSVVGDAWGRTAPEDE